MVSDLIKQLLEAGVHFGHQTRRWNPKMKRFIFGERSSIYIIDLEKTVECLNAARDFLKDIASKGGKILFVGTKKQAQDIIIETAQKNGMYYVINRWSGGLMTNFQTVKKSISRLNEIERMHQDGVLENLSKKEVAHLNKEKEKLIFNFGGIRDMKGAPQAVFIVDPKREEIAVQEARKLNIPIAAIIDTNCDPDEIDYPIPGNDDALKSIRLICSLICESVEEGAKEFAKTQPKKKEAAEKGEPPQKEGASPARLNRSKEKEASSIK